MKQRNKDAQNGATKFFSAFANKTSQPVGRASTFALAAAVVVILS
jgi:hypothetical protein